MLHSLTEFSLKMNVNFHGSNVSGFFCAGTIQILTHKRSTLSFFKVLFVQPDPSLSSYIVLHFERHELLLENVLREKTCKVRQNDRTKSSIKAHNAKKLSKKSHKEIRGFKIGGKPLVLFFRLEESKF